MAALRGFTAADIYAGRRKGNLQLGKLGSINTGSRELLTAQVTGRPVDPKKVGSPGDIIPGAENIAAFLNELCGFSNP